ncbi:MAG: hypothetical protein AB3K77_16195 [Methanosarcinaceae archaeon]|uniref:hypothetical protein n=1 Tax=Methanosarcina sp. MTP4 TaxID=1434100 RepID=UPI000A8B62D1|nr:hypothetical protein [Methanosarcina sp. MTP4]
MNGYYHSKKVNIRKPEKQLFSDQSDERSSIQGSNGWMGIKSSMEKLRGRDF